MTVLLQDTKLGEAGKEQEAAENLTDEEYLSQVLPGDYAIQQGYARPRFYGMTLGYKY